MTTSPSASPRRRSLWLWILLAVIAAAAGVCASHSVFSPKPAADGAVEALYQAKLPAPNGSEVDLGKLRGRTLVVNFWAPWCGPCVEEMPELTALHKEYTARNVEFIGIGIDSARNIEQFLQKVPVAYPLAVAGFAGTELARSLGNAQGGLPYTLVIAPDGAVKFSKLGRVHMEELRAVLPKT
ncbi:TlpA family protein disulfide reductase [Cupriavidus plantarum]|uniref:TlpA family protein disulfide reductase n=1 Tax=Cupriavidus plantarum TaxID=942865 RepID=UPI000E24065A|nr:TlpA disulfide reductase family protein [Cupriavidus plantarum]REF03002.1 thiol-disulfide isomerase/thioredoxin [Cupriavidus plantarum]